MKILKRISSGETTHSDSKLVQWGCFIILVIGLTLGYYLGGL